MQNPVTLDNVPVGKGAIWCVSNAAYQQRVVLDVSGTPVVFEGTGEGVAMNCPLSGGPIMPFDMPAPFTITAMFEYSPNGQDFMLASVVKEPVIIQFDFRWIAQIESEDSTDNDDNDSRLQVAVWIPDPPDPPRRDVG